MKTSGDGEALMEAMIEVDVCGLFTKFQHQILPDYETTNPSERRQ